MFYCCRNHIPTNEAGAVQRSTGKDTDTQMLLDMSLGKGHTFRNVPDQLNEAELFCLILIRNRLQHRKLRYAKLFLSMRVHTDV